MFPWGTTMGAVIYQPGSGKVTRASLDRSAYLSSTSAEIFGLILALQHLDDDGGTFRGTVDLFTDSQAMVRVVPVKKAATDFVKAATTMPAEQVRELQHLKHTRLVKTKAHRSYHTAALQNDVEKYLGNKKAAEQAGFAAETFGFTEHQLKEFTARRKAAAKYAAKAAAAFEMYETTVRLQTRPGGRQLLTS